MRTERVGARLLAALRTLTCSLNEPKSGMSHFLSEGKVTQIDEWQKMNEIDEWDLWSPVP